MTTGHAWIETTDPAKAPAPAAPQPAAPDPLTLGYATPATRVRHTPTSAMAGLALAVLGAAVLLIGVVTLAEYSRGIDEGLQIMFALAVCVFSGVCLLTALPLIYRGTRGPIQ